MKTENEHLIKCISEKEELLVKISEENEVMKEEFDIQKVKSSEFNAPKEISEITNFKSLFAEIQSANTYQSCVICTKVFTDEYLLKEHREKCLEKDYLKDHESELLKTMSQQRTNLQKQIFSIKETEIHKKYSCNSDCQPTCCISHEKHVFGPQGN